MSGPIYNPLDKVNLGKSVAQALLDCQSQALANLIPFDGAGVYAIYYSGTFAPYEHLAKLNRSSDPKAPIYVGKAVPEGARKGGAAGEPVATRALHRRLQDHAKSIAAVPNLNVADFSCRYLVVDDIWIPLGESLLITTFSPLWNLAIDGFGNHDPGGGRYGGLAPRWDILHPGRSWAAKCKPRAETGTLIESEVVKYLQTSPSLVRLHLTAAAQAQLQVTPSKKSKKSN